MPACGAISHADRQRRVSEAHHSYAHNSKFRFAVNSPDNVQASAKRAELKTIRDRHDMGTVAMEAHTNMLGERPQPLAQRQFVLSPRAMFMRGVRSRSLGLMYAGAVRPLLIDPRTSRFIASWDMLTSAGLLFTAVVTPYEAALLSGSEQQQLFIINRVIDVIFIIDLLIQFVLIYQPSTKESSTWEADPRKIASHYLRGWFTIDLISILASLFDIGQAVGWFESSSSGGGNGETDSAGATSSTGGGGGGGSRTTTTSAGYAVLRMVRLIKLMRLVRLKRMLKRWETRVSISYATTTLVKSAVVICAISHWYACLWVIQTAFTASSVIDTWIGALGLCWHAEDGNEVICAPADEIYSASLYWSMMTITSIGYGDVAVTASNAREQLVAVVLMLIGGITWGFVIATLLSIANNADPSAYEYRSALDELNRFMRLHMIPDELRRRLREYLSEIRSLNVTRTHHQLLAILSPKLLEDVTVKAYVNDTPLERVSLFANVEMGFLAQVSLSMVVKVYPPTEYVPIGSLHLLQRGRSHYRGRLLLKGSHWGEDCFLSNPRLRLDARARAITYIEVGSIAGEVLLSIANQFGYWRAYRQLRRYTAILALRREIMRRSAEHYVHELNCSRTAEQKAALCKNATDNMSRQTAIHILKETDRRKGSALIHPVSISPAMMAPPLGGAPSMGFCGSCATGCASAAISGKHGPGKPSTQRSCANFSTQRQDPNPARRRSLIAARATLSGSSGARSPCGMRPPARSASVVAAGKANGLDGSFTRTTTVKFDEDRSSTAGGSILAGVDAARSRSPPVAEAGSNGLSPNVGALPAASGSAANQETSSERNSSFLGGSGSLLSELGALLTPKSPAKQNLSPTLSPRSRDDMRELLNGIAQNLAAQQQQISELVERLDAESSQHSC